MSRPEDVGSRTKNVNKILESPYKPNHPTRTPSLSTGTWLGSCIPLGWWQACRCHPWKQKLGKPLIKMDTYIYQGWTTRSIWAEKDHAERSWKQSKLKHEISKAEAQLGRLMNFPMQNSLVVRYLPKKNVVSLAEPLLLGSIFCQRKSKHPGIFHLLVFFHADKLTVYCQDCQSLVYLLLTMLEVQDGDF